MLENLIIRAETPADYRNTELMTMRSFWNKYFPGCSEHNMVRIIRDSKDYIPQISRVAEVDGKIVGAVYYTKAWIDDGSTKREVALLGPLAVEPTMEGNGIGGALINESIKLAKKTGIAGIILAGEPGYYPKFDFELCEKYGITDGEGNCYDAYMCYPLTDEFKLCKGKFIESADFEKIEDEKLLAEIAKDFPAYRKVKVQEGFMQIFVEHLGVVESIQGDVYNVRYWELVIPAKLSENLETKPTVGSDVQFFWNHKGGESKITKVIKNLLSYQIRDVKLEDAARLVEIYSYYVLNTAVSFEYAVPTVEEFENRIRNITQKYPYLVCEREGKIVGFVYVHAYSPREAYSWTVETSIYVDKDCHRSGAGSLLYKELENRLKKMGIVNLLAGVAFCEKEDEYLTHDSPNFHLSQGYIEVAHMKGVGKKFDRWYDLKWFQKKI